MFDIHSFNGRYFLTSSLAGQGIRRAYYSRLASGLSVAPPSIAGMHNIPAIAALSILESGEQAFSFPPAVFKMMTEIPVEDCGTIAWPYDGFWVDFPHKEMPPDAGLISLGLMVFNAKKLPPFFDPKEGSLERSIQQYADRVVVGVYGDCTGSMLQTASLLNGKTDFRNLGPSAVFGIGRHLFASVEKLVFVVSFLSKDPTSEEMNYIHDLSDTHDMFVHLIALQNRIAVQVALWLDSDQQRDQQRETTLARKKIERVCSRTEPTQEAQINHFSPTITRLGVGLEQCLNNFLSSKEARQLDASVQEREGCTTSERESPQAHLVRAHWRRYWKGKGRAIQERKLILPFPRGVGEYKPRIYTKN